MNSGDLNTVNEALSSSMPRAEADLVVVLDDTGRVIAGTNGLAATPTAFTAVVRRADEQGVARTTAGVAGITYEMVTIPFGNWQHANRAWLSMGIALDNERAQRIGQFTGMQVALLSDRDGTLEVLGSSITEVSPGEIAAIIAEAYQLNGTFAVRIGGRDHLAVQRPLLAGHSDITVLLLESFDTALATYRELRLPVVAVGVLALIVALGGAAVVSRAITSPLQQLAQAARRIREGDYRETVAVTGGEMGELASAFNTMQEGIAERENRITYQARYDGLTGLPNRILALEHLGEAIGRASSNGGKLAVLVVDLGSFNTIASSLGHDIGDALLSQAAERLRGSVDARHTVARIEGDEFLIILEETNLEDTRELAEDLLRLLAVGLCVHDVNVSLDAVIGIAVFPDHGREPDQLLLRATVAKNDGRHAQQRLHIYQDGSEEGRRRQLAILGDLRRAVRHDELKLYLQPKISLRSGGVCGVEALVRWDHPAFGLLQPAEFIPVAEQSGNISLITRWALTAAVRECRLWLEEGLELPVSVNLSTRDLLDQNLPMFILQLLRNHDLASRYLIVEVTEEALVRDFAHASLVLQCLRDLGVRISIDDFGTGYSSLAQIKRLPVDELKIDRSFVMGLPDSAQDAAIVRLAVDLAHSLGLEVVAEGVETRPALDWLSAHGCERAQGYLIARPMPAEIFDTWIRDQIAADATLQVAAMAVAS
jgi:diguanylate cyclase (GGDEF)-like protein